MSETKKYYWLKLKRDFFKRLYEQHKGLIK